MGKKKKKKEKKYVLCVQNNIILYYTRIQKQSNSKYSKLQLARLFTICSRRYTRFIILIPIESMHINIMSRKHIV